MDTENKIKELIDQIRPFLMADGGNVEFIKYENNIVYLKMQGACADCHMLDLTLKNGIEAMLIEEIPEIKEVINLN